MQRSGLITRSYNWLMPCAFLTQSIRDFIANLSPFNLAFNQNIFPYYRDDIPVQLLPAMNIYIARVQSKGKYYYKYYFTNIDIYIPQETTHKRTDDMSHAVLSWLDMVFKRPDFQNYISRYNPGVMDVAGVNYTTQAYNHKKLDTKYDVQVIGYGLQVKFDRMIWAEELINKYGVSPSNIDMIFEFSYLRQAVPNTIYSNV